MSFSRYIVPFVSRPVSHSLVCPHENGQRHAPRSGSFHAPKGRGIVESDIVLAKLYVAVPRPRYILGVIVPDNFNTIIDGFS